MFLPLLRKEIEVKKSPPPMLEHRKGRGAMI